MSKVIDISKRSKAASLAKSHSHKELGVVKRAVNRALSDLSGKVPRTSPADVVEQCSALGIDLGKKDAVSRLQKVRETLLAARKLRRDAAAKKAA
jgi:hypothetical protein